MIWLNKVNSNSCSARSKVLKVKNQSNLSQQRPKRRISFLIKSSSSKFPKVVKQSRKWKEDSVPSIWKQLKTHSKIRVRPLWLSKMASRKNSAITWACQQLIWLTSQTIMMKNSTNTSLIWYKIALSSRWWNKEQNSRRKTTILLIKPRKGPSLTTHMKVVTHHFPKLQKLLCQAPEAKSQATVLKISGNKLRRTSRSHMWISFLARIWADNWWKIGTVLIAKLILHHKWTGVELINNPRIALLNLYNALTMIRISTQTLSSQQILQVRGF